ncbi:MAG: F0F1 ATP synthase subunit B, partial [Gluconacetobacter diazotrophicus]|nr:F0F1 ATP synthase subunit B [Gluconacetobacter diazotrophicus]
ARREREATLAESEAMIARAREEAARIAASQRAATAEIRAVAADAATEAARSVLREHFSAADDVALTDRAIASLPAAFRRAAA